MFFFSSRRRHTRLQGDWSSDVCSSDLEPEHGYSGKYQNDHRPEADGGPEDLARNPKHATLPLCGARYFANSPSLRKRTVGSLAKSCCSHPRCPAPKMTSTRSVGESASCITLL